MSDDLINITIDGHAISVPKGTLLVEAARKIGLEIPVYCYHPKLKPVGACRVCIVEVEKQRRPMMTACTTTVMPDMVVHTQSENAVAAREGILEFLLINHPLDCPVCDRAGECDLQDFTVRYGQPTTRFIEQKRHFEKSKQVGQNVILDRERCIMCQRCVRFCDEIAMEEGLVIVDRGYRSEIGTFEGRSFDSRFSGNVIELCPVGALTAKTYRFESRPWEQQHYSGISNVCSLGSNITVDVRYDKVVRIRSRMNESIDDGWLTDECRYSHLAVHSEDRISEPMIRNASGDLETATWSKALEVVKKELKKEKARVALLAGTKLSCEDGHALLKLGRGVLETSDVVHEFASEAMVVKEQLTGQVFGCDDADVILCLGCDPGSSHSAFELRIKKGLQKKAKLVCLGDSESSVGFADYQALGEASKLWSKLLKALAKQHDSQEEGLALPAPRPWEAGGETSDDWDALVGELAKAKKVLVVVTGVLESQGLASLPTDIATLGWNTAPHGLLHLRSGVNSVGLGLVGLGSDWTDEQADKYREAWGTFNSKSSKSFEELSQSGLDVMLAIACDPMAVENSKKSKFLIVAASHPNLSTNKADVVLPLSSWLESNGVFVSTDGTVQFNRQAILPVDEAKPGHQIAQLFIQELKEETVAPSTPRQIYRELGRVNGHFSGASYSDFKSPGEVHWSYPQQADLGMPRPDLSAIPVNRPDSPMWMPAVPTGSKVELAGRLHRGQTPPAVPGQRNPREISALLGLSEPVKDSLLSNLSSSAPVRREGYIALRVAQSGSAEPAGPTPSHRHHEIGVGRRRQIQIPVAEVASPEESEKKPVIISQTRTSAL